MSNRTATQAKPSILNVPWVVEPALVEAKRDSDGRFLRQHVELSAAPRIHTAADEALAGAFGCDADELFAGRPGK